jgi:hypothetical protein
MNARVMREETRLNTDMPMFKIPSVKVRAGSALPGHPLGPGPRGWGLARGWRDRIRTQTAHVSPTPRRHLALARARATAQRNMVASSSTNMVVWFPHIDGGATISRVAPGRPSSIFGRQLGVED